MKVTLSLFFIFFFNFHLFAISLDEKSSHLDLLSKSFIYIDTTNSLSKDEVLLQKFKKNTLSSINLGISPNTVLWIKFTLKNSTNKELHKILEYHNPETENVYLYYDDVSIRDGMFHHHENRESLNPIFKIRLAPLEEKTFYIKAHCTISTLISELIIWKEIDFIKSSTKHLYILFIFFAVIVTLLIYNLMLFIFTKQLAYFYYILYLSAVIFFEAIYLGVAQLYLFSNAVSIFMTKGTIGYITILVLPMILFTMEFLNTQRFKKIHNFLTLYLYLLPIVSILSFNNFLFDLNIMIIYFPLAFAMMYAAFLTYKKGQKEAIYYLLGWSVIIISLLLSVWKSLGGFDVTLHFVYINELAFALEALLFSVALAYRINILSKQRDSANNQLIHFQRNEQERLEILVNQQTNELQLALAEKEILYKELNHRVKNNIQMIISLLKLQISKTEFPATKDALTIANNRIYSIAKLYETLQFSEDKNNLNTKLYFQSIVKNIQDNFTKNIKIEYNIFCEINVKYLVYCGFIVNELITNSFKYAFDQTGTIEIKTHLQNKQMYLLVKDNGKGFDKNRVDSLGLTIVETLAKDQLQGTLELDTNNGTTTTISWSLDE